MIKGRELLGLPVFSWMEGTILGRVMDILIDQDDQCLKGIILNKKNMRKENKVVFYKDILKIYRDGIIITSLDRIHEEKIHSSDGLFYIDYLQSIHLPLKEGEIISDLIFDIKNQIEGYEVSRGIWDDISYGRSFYSLEEGSK